MPECCGSSIPLYAPSPGCALNASTTLVSSCSFGEPAGRRKVRQIAEPEPAEEPVRRGRVLERLLARDLRVDLLRVPVGATGADEARAAGLQLLPGVLAVRRLPADGRRKRHPEREDLSAVDDERAGRIEGDARHAFEGTPVPLDSPVPDPVRGLASYV
jgi:hypothetical protein